MNEPSYPAARAVAVAVEARFAARHSAAVQEGQQGLAPLPDAATIEAIVDVTFWASLRREEGLSPRISLALIPPERAGQPMLFERPLPLAPASLAKLGPAVERPGVHLGVWHGGGGLYVWGATRSIPHLCFVLEVVEPGLLVIKHRREIEFAKFGNVAVLRGDEVKLVDERGASLRDCPPLFERLLGFGTPDSWGDPDNVLVRLAVSMRAHGRGGSLLVVPADDPSWRESMIPPIPYPIVPAFTRLARLLGERPAGGDPSDWRDAVQRAVEGVAGVTAVDGATVINDRYELLAFGAKIGRRDGCPPVERILVTEPVLGSEPQLGSPSTIGGTRHLSAAQFTQDQRDAMALVASQDGRFTVLAWSPCGETVHAHRVETLLL